MIAALLVAAALPSLADLGSAAEGTYVEYEVHAARGPAAYVRLAAREAEGEGRWVELWMSARPGSASQVLRGLVQGGVVRRLLVRLGSGPVQEVDPAALRLPAPLARGCKGGCAPRLRERRLGRVPTRAGLLEVTEREVRARGATVRMRVSPQVPLGGVVLLELEGVRAELIATGADSPAAIPRDAPARPLPAPGERRSAGEAQRGARPRRARPTRRGRPIRGPAPGSAAAGVSAPRFTRSESGQAAAEYAWVTFALLGGAAALGWPYLRLLLEGLAAYLGGIYFVLDGPFP